MIPFIHSQTQQLFIILQLWSDDITNLAVKFFTDSTWESYQIEEVICSVATGFDTTGWNYFFFSLGELPEDSLIYTKQVFSNSLSSFPEIIKLNLIRLLLSITKEVFL